MKKAVTGAVILILCAVLMIPVLNLSFGSPEVSQGMDDYFIAHGQEQTGANNIVTSIVFDYRGFDTLGEATVLFTAVLAVGLVFRKLKRGEEYEYE